MKSRTAKIEPSPMSVGVQISGRTLHLLPADPSEKFQLLLKVADGMGIGEAIRKSEADAAKNSPVEYAEMMSLYQFVMLGRCWDDAELELETSLDPIDGSVDDMDAAQVVATGRAIRSEIQKSRRLVRVADMMKALGEASDVAAEAVRLGN